MWSALITAFRTLTILPVPGRDANRYAYSLPFFPLVGLFLGVGLYLAAFGSMSFLTDSYLIAALFVVFLSTVLTGGLHLDGLADSVDAFGGGHSKERILEIMKDSRHGTFGVLALIFAVVSKIVFIAQCLEAGQIWPIALAVFFSRTYMALGCSLFSYARPETGTASAFTSNKLRPVIVIIFLFQAGCVLYITDMYAMMMIFGSLLTTMLFFLYCHLRIGGITGDCIGAGNEIAELSFLLIGALYCNFNTVS